jgi:hypothetical protein
MKIGSTSATESDILSEDDIAFLCDICEFELTEDKHPAQLQRLIAAGFVEPANAAQQGREDSLRARRWPQ